MELIVPTVDPRIKAFLDHAFDLSVLLSNPKMIPTLYNSYISLNYSFGWEDRLDIEKPVYLGRHIWDAKRFQFRNSLSFFDSEDPVEMIVENNKRMICEGYCVLGEYDEYHVPGKKTYGKSHYIHNYLISGFNDEEKSFTVHGYSSKNGLEQYGKVNLEIDYYKCAISIDRKPFPDTMQLWRYLEYRKVNINNVDISLDTAKIKRSIESFLEPDDNDYGINVFTIISEFQDQTINLRDIRLLYEHAKLMVKRAECLTKHRLISNSSDLIELLDTVTRFAEALFYKTVKIKILNKDYSDIRKALLRLAELEQNAFKLFVYKLK